MLASLSPYKIIISLYFIFHNLPIIDFMKLLLQRGKYFVISPHPLSLSQRERDLIMNSEALVWGERNFFVLGYFL